MAERSDTPPATQATGLEPPKSDTAGDAPNNQLSPNLTGDSATTATQKRGRGRPAKPKSDSQQNDAQPARKPMGRPKRNESTAAVVKSGSGRPKRSNTQPVTAPLVATTADGSRKRARPKKDDVAAATVPGPAKKRGRNPKSEKVDSKRASRRAKKATEATAGQGAANPAELKRKAALLQKKVKQAADKLKIAVTAIEEVQAIAAGM